MPLAVCTCLRVCNHSGMDSDEQMNDPSDPKIKTAVTANCRFRKTIASTAVAPIYRLHLPQAIVEQSMAQLVGQRVYLATSAVGHSWEAEIVGRRNKTRTDYILKVQSSVGQGWKLFAEAHQLKADTCLDFELCGDRLVVNIVKESMADHSQEASLSSFPSPSLPSHKDEGTEEYLTRGVNEMRMQNSQMIAEMNSSIAEVLDALQCEMDANLAKLYNAETIVAANQSLLQQRITELRRKGQLGLATASRLEELAAAFQAQLESQVIGFPGSNVPLCTFQDAQAEIHVWLEMLKTRLASLTNIQY